jgi:hypothetical protein
MSTINVLWPLISRTRTDDDLELELYYKSIAINCFIENFLAVSIFKPQS